MCATNLIFGFVCAFLVTVNAQCELALECQQQQLVDDVSCQLAPASLSPCLPTNYGVSSCGPFPCSAPIRQLEPLVLPAVDGPVFVLPSPPPPPPTVISHKCSCSKTVLKPQLYQRVIQVQKNQRFIKKSFKPVIEKIQYCANPRC